MKTLAPLFLTALFITIGCTKPAENATTIPAPIYFEILNKNGSNAIHSVKDSLVVTYVLNGVSNSYRLNIYKVQVSVTDTTTVSKYNGFVISDRNLSNHYDQGYMATASGQLGVRNFNFYLNGINIGAVNFDYWGAQSFAPFPATFPAFTLNSIPATPANLLGVYIDGAIVENYTTGQGNFVCVLQQ